MPRDGETKERYAVTDASEETRARALWYVSKGRAVLCEEGIGAKKPDHVRVRTLWSALSRGTERLVAEGRVPASEYGRMRAPLQEGDFPFPVKYGYSAVGRVEDGPHALVGRLVFALAPHAEIFDAPLAFVQPVPDHVPARRVVLASNMETALNALWDGGAAPGDRIVVVGAGVVGCLVASLAARIPGAEVTLVDVDLSRREIAQALGCRFSKPLDSPGDADLVVHTSATSAGLSCALACAGDEARVVELSWYGEATTEVSLGARFHSARLALVSSQVGRVATPKRARWSHARRLAKAIDLLDDPRLDALITHEIAFDDLPDAIPRLLAPGAPGLATAIRYS
ncbi:zinc-dependent alcohol dehydrogenase [Salinarimonas ramus]|uniref:Dehydrogenase n=1 Tax=Salinarimonas ramus TaxID=690164 RepID=A0A917V5R8_9HYPH|nr:zinc-binding alcohol dehydrogenase [Salinarimonas ramus]GGK41425.1 dehydrogenase [Salinarimonas ramus]